MRKLPAARFFLVGRDPAAAVQALDGQNGITVTGTVEDPADWIARATVCVAPIRAAAGLQNKLLEAMAMAKAVVATPVANEGIRAPAKARPLLLAQDPGPLCRAGACAAGDAALRQRLGVAARAFVEAKWTWEGPFLELEQAFLATGRLGQPPRARIFLLQCTTNLLRSGAASLDIVQCSINRSYPDGQDHSSRA